MAAVLEAHPSPERRPVAPLAFAVVLATLVIVSGIGGLSAGLGHSSSGASAVVATPDVGQTLSTLPLSFVENAGQMQDEVFFTVTGSETSLGFSDRGVAWRVTDGEDAYVVRQAFIGGRAVTPVGVNPQRARFSWFRGSPDEWVKGARAYSAVRYEGVWPGIDVVYAGDASEVEYRFIVAPGADPSSIRLAYRGADTTLDPSGGLRVATPVRSFTDKAPRAYQRSSSVPSRFLLRPDGTYSFSVGAYDASEPLVIDPAVLVYAGFIGGDSGEYGTAVTVDASGAAYITGATQSTEATFPVMGGPGLTTHVGNTEAFVAKVTPSGTALAYAGYIGGSGGDYGRGIAVDGSGAAYVAGYTNSTETSFPVTGGPDVTGNGDWDAFVAKVTPAGTSLSYTGYIGGSLHDEAAGIAVDGSGAAYVAGYTNSTEATFPVTGGPDISYNGGSNDAFVAKVAPSGAALAYAGYIGGSGWDDAAGIAVDGSGATYVAGTTGSDEATFPVSVGPDLTYNGFAGDAFVAKLSPSGATFYYAGFIGGSGYDSARGIAVDGSGAAYVVGDAYSDEATFPVTVGPDLTYNGGAGGGDAFVAKVATSGASLSYAGYIGGSGDDSGMGVAVDGSGFAYVAGLTSSSELSFPVSGGPSLVYGGGGDAFVAKVATSGASLSYAGYIGGSQQEDAWAIATDGSGDVYVTGSSASSETTFPVLGGPDLTFNGVWDVFVAKVVEPFSRPDTRIRTAVGVYKGEDVYNLDASGQSVAGRLAPGRTATFHLGVQNDGNVADAITVLGCANDAGLRASYLEGSTTVTSQVKAGSYSTGSLSSGLGKDLTLQVKARRTAQRGARLICLVTATSVADGTKADAVKATVTVR